MLVGAGLVLRSGAAGGRGNSKAADPQFYCMQGVGWDVSGANAALVWQQRQAPGVQACSGDISGGGFGFCRAGMAPVPPCGHPCARYHPTERMSGRVALLFQRRVSCWECRADTGACFASRVRKRFWLLRMFGRQGHRFCLQRGRRAARAVAAVAAGVGGKEREGGPWNSFTW